MFIRSILKNKKNEVLSISPDTEIASAAGLLRQHRIGALIVAEDDDIRGILSERDIVRGLAESGSGCLDMPASELMSHPVITCTPDDSIDSAMATMTENRFRHLPVVEEGNVCGMVSIGDIVKHKIEQIEHEAEDMRSYISSA